MPVFLRRTAGLASVAVLLAIAGSVSAQTTLGANATAEARIDWAKRHVELVCRPLEAKGRKTEAAKCFERVSLFIADPQSAIPDENPTPLRRTAEPEPSAVQPPERPASTEPRRLPVIRTAAVKHLATARAYHHRIAKVTAPRQARPLVVASNDQVLTPTIPVRDASPAAKRCGSLPCSRIMTMLGVGY